MNFTDVIELTPTETRNPRTQKLVTFKEQYGHFEGFVSTLGQSQSQVVKTLRQQAVDTFEQQRLSLMLENSGGLDKRLALSLDGKPTILDALVESPKTSLGSIRRFADTFGFVVIPFAYMDPVSYKREPAATHRLISNFTKWDEQFPVFALCPVVFYSLRRHLQADDADLPIYGGQHSQAFMAIQMCLPVFGTLIQDVKDIKVRTELLDERLGKAENSLASLAKKVDELQAAVERNQRAMVLAHVEQARRTELETWKAARFSSYDPLLFAVPKGVNPCNDESWAALGPCWGPDFEDVVFKAHGLKMKIGQRQLIEESTKKNWGWK